jgi:hypothetical protein
MLAVVQKQHNRKNKDTRFIKMTFNWLKGQIYSIKMIFPNPAGIFVGENRHFVGKHTAFTELLLTQAAIWLIFAVN